MDQDLDNFLARCLLCASAPNKHLPDTHVGIFSPAGIAQKLADKIAMHLPSVQIEEGMPKQVCKACIGKLNYCTMFENSSRKARDLLRKIKPKAKKTVKIKTIPQDYKETTYYQPPEAVFIQEMNINVLPKMESIISEEVDIKSESDDVVAQTSVQKESQDVAGIEQETSIPNHTAITSSNMAEFDLTRCGICKLHFSQCNLTLHIKRMHRSLRVPDELGDQNSHSAQCDICDKTVPKKKLWTHLKVKHKLDWIIRKEGHILQCPMCPLEVSVPGILFHLSYCHGIQCKSTEKLEHGMMSLEKLSAQLAPQSTAENVTPQKNVVPTEKNAQDTIQARNESVTTPDEPANKEKEEDVKMISYCVICERFMAESNFWYHVKTMHSLGWLEKDGDIIHCPLCPAKLKENELLTHFESGHDIQIKSHGYKTKRMTLRDLAVQCAPKSHSQVVPPSPLIICVHCNLPVKNMPNKMEYHIAAKHPGGNILLCGICDENFLHTGKEQPHMYNKNKEQCENYKRSRVFNTIDKTKHEHKNHEVQTQPRSTPNKVHVNTNKTVRLTGGRVQCDICFRTVRNSGRLIVHKNTLHGTNLKFYCETCGNGYSSAFQARQHEKNVHFNRKTCPICGDQLNRGVYKKHVSAHLKEKYKQNPRYSGHTPYNPVYCYMCQTRFNHKYLIIKHINKKHLGTVKTPLKYWCEYCNKGPFKNYINVLAHIANQHVPKLTCDFCGVQKCRLQLITHMRQSHKEIFRPVRKVVKKKSDKAQWVQC